MTTLVPALSLDSIPELEVTTIARGGPGQVMNAQAQALLNRVEYYNSLKNSSSFNQQIGATYTLALTDTGLTIILNNSTSVTLTVPLNSLVAFPIGTNIDIIQDGIGKVTVVPGAGVTLNSIHGFTTIAAQYAGITLRKVNSDIWYLFGALAPF